MNKKINKGMGLPDTDHVVRHVPFKKLHTDADGNIIGFLFEAFQLREIDEGDLSVNWVEYFEEGSHVERVEKTIHEIRKVKPVGSKSAFGVSSVLAIKQTCRNTPKSIKIVYWPTTTKDGVPNVTHALIRHLPEDDIELLDALATTAFSTLIRNSDIP